MGRVFFLIILLVALFSFSFAQTGSGEFGKTSYVQAALKGDIYFLPEGADMLPDFSKLKPVGSIYTKQLNIAPRSFESGFPGVTDRTEWFAIQYNGAFSAKVAGNYAFRLLSDDGSKLYIDGKLIIDNDGVHGPSDVGQSVDLTVGIHTIRVEYFQGPRYDIALQLFMAAPGADETLFSADAELPGKTSDFGASEKIIGAFKGDIYNIPEKTSKLPVFSQLQPVGSIYTKKIDISPRRFDGGFPGVTDRTEWFAIQYNGAFLVKTSGTYTFRIHSDDGSKLYVDGELIIDNDGIHGPLSKNGTVNLNMGVHSVRVEYFQGPRYNIALQLFVTAPGSKETIFASDAEANGGNNDTGKTSDFGGASKIAAAFKGEIYDLPVNTRKLPDFSQMKPVGTIYTKKIDIAPRRFDSGFPGVTDKTEWFAIQYNGAFFVKAAGSYKFRLLSDDGSKLYIDGNLIIDNDGTHGPSSKIGTVDLNMGVHAIRLEYFQGPRYDIALQLFVTAPGFAETIFATDAEPQDTTKTTTTKTTDTSSDFGVKTVIPGAFKGEIYLLPENTPRLPDFSKLNPVGTIYTKKIDISPRKFESGFPGVTDRTEWFGIQYNGGIFIMKGGMYSFRLLSDDGSKLYIDNKLVIDNDGLHPPQDKTGQVQLKMGMHFIRVEYFQGPRYDLALQLFLTPPGGKEQIFQTR